MPQYLIKSHYGVISGIIVLVLPSWWIFDATSKPGPCPLLEDIKCHLFISSF